MIKIFLESKEAEDERFRSMNEQKKRDFSFLRLTKQVRFE